MANNSFNPAQHPTVTQTTPFTPAELTDIRRHAGFSVYAAFGYAYGNGLMSNLDIALANMSDDEQAVIRTVYLANLNSLESAILTAATNIGSDMAGVWKRNRTEIADRRALYNQKRRDMCAFVGIAPGPGLGSGGGQVVRC